ncbi:hypothetical protein [Amphritea sp.]|uniref:hypothetical protein n=1 Tax=Amphritea sp. TaxID=1872502 RepID=UPI0025BB4F6C|nr:hypothetical protein [Amphritea sp.]
MAIFVIDKSINLKHLEIAANSNAFFGIGLELNVLANLNRHADADNMVIYNDFTAQLANGLRQGDSLADIQFYCQSAFGDLIEFFKRNRTTCQLISLRGLLAADKNSIIQQFGDAPAEEIRALVQTFEKTIIQDDFYSLAALQLQNSDKRLVKLAAELEACSVIAYEGSDVHNLEKIINDYLTEKQEVDKKLYVAEESLKKCEEEGRLAFNKFETENKELQRQIDEKNGQIENVLHQLFVLQSAFDEAQKSQKITVQQHSDTVNTIESHVTGLQQELKQTKIENKELVEQLHFVQETLEEVSLSLQTKELANQSLMIEKTKSEADCKKSNEKTQGLSKEVTKVRQTLAFQQEENELLIEQLHNVQELYEYKLIQTENSAGIQKTLNQRVSEKDREIHALNKLLDAGLIYQKWLIALLHAAHKQLFNQSRGFRKKLKQQAKLLNTDKVFDGQWYLQAYPDLEGSKLDLKIHYLLFGAFEARNPSGQFHTLNYIQTYADVAEAGMQPIIHFIQFGQFEGRMADPLQKRLPAPGNSESKA